MNVKHCLTAQPLLSITIPTFNRARDLERNLRRLTSEISKIDTHLVEVLISDNASEDITGKIVQTAIDNGLPARYVRNAKNIGSDANFAHCFNFARGKYVMIMGDDDLFSHGALSALLSELKDAPKGGYGVVCMRPYAYDEDPDEEFPGGHGESSVYLPSEFLVRIAHLLTFISSLVINKELLVGVDANQFCGGQLVQVHLALRAALAGKSSLVMNRYMLACLRSSSPAFDYGKVFVLELGRILDEHIQFGLSTETIMRIEGKMLSILLPYLALRQRLADVGDPIDMYERIAMRYHGRVLFHFGLGPVLLMPRPVALVWGSGVVVAGRLLNGDLRRGFWFAWHRLFSSIRKK